MLVPVTGPAPNLKWTFGGKTTPSSNDASLGLHNGMHVGCSWASTSGPSVTGAGPGSDIGLKTASVLDLFRAFENLAHVGMIASCMQLACHLYMPAVNFLLYPKPINADLDWIWWLESTLDTHVHGRSFRRVCAPWCIILLDEINIKLIPLINAHGQKQNL